MPDPAPPHVDAAAHDGPRIVVLTAGNPYGVGVVRRLADRGIRCTVALQSEAALRDGDAVLELPRWSTVNGHPALLPWVRGNSVVAYSVSRGVAVGASVHRVDAGFDTGPVLARRLLPVPAGATLERLEAAAVSLAATLLADVVADVAGVRALPDGTAQAARTPFCRWMAPAGRRAVESAVAAGEAERLFRRWRAACEPEGPPWDLPREAVPPAHGSSAGLLPNVAS